MIDQLGNKVQLEGVPKRIVSLVPSQTELLYDLGLGDSVVGLTKFCIHPENWRKEKTIIGGTKNFRFEVIDELKPDLIIANKEENYKEGIEQLVEKYPVYISDIYTLEDAYRMMLDIGKMTHAEERANQIINTIRKGVAGLPKVNKRVAYLIWNKPIMVAGCDTFINELLNHCGLENVFAHLSRYPEVTIQNLQEFNCDYILLSSEPYPFKEIDIVQFQDKIKKSKVILVDGESFSWYGSRLMSVIAYLHKLLSGL